MRKMRLLLFFPLISSLSATFVPKSSRQVARALQKGNVARIKGPHPKLRSVVKAASHDFLEERPEYTRKTLGELLGRDIPVFSRVFKLDVPIATPLEDEYYSGLGHLSNNEYDYALDRRNSLGFISATSHPGLLQNETNRRYNPMDAAEIYRFIHFANDAPSACNVLAELLNADGLVQVDYRGPEQFSAPEGHFIAVMLAPPSEQDVEDGVASYRNKPVYYRINADGQWTYKDGLKSVSWRDLHSRPPGAFCGFFQVPPEMKERIKLRRRPEIRKASVLTTLNMLRDLYFDMYDALWSPIKDDMTSDEYRRVSYVRNNALPMHWDGLLHRTSRCWDKEMDWTRITDYMDFFFDRISETTRYFRDLIENPSKQLSLENRQLVLTYLQESEAPLFHLYLLTSNSEENDEEIEEDFEPLNKEEKAKLRREYIDLHTELNDAQEELSKPAAQGLKQKIQEINRLFGDVKSADDATLDSRLLLLTADIGLRKAKAMKFDISVFDVDEFLEKIKGNLERDNQEMDWMRLEKEVTRCTLKAPSIDFMLGPLAVEQKVKERKKVIRHAKNTSEIVEPTQLKDGDIQKAENATAANVKSVHRALVESGRTQFFEFIINPDSYSQSVENLFYLSFLLREGKAKIELGTDGLPYVEVIQGRREEDEIRHDNRNNKQMVADIDMDSWRESKELFNITRSKIPTRVSLSEQALSSNKWYG